MAVVGGGFTGLAAAYELTRRGVGATVLEADRSLGGLAGSFDVDGTRLEKFYHHWFTSDRHVMELVREVGEETDVVYRSTRTGMYYANSFYRLSSPLDVLKFAPLRLTDRIRLGMMLLRGRAVDDASALPSSTWIMLVALGAIPLVLVAFGYAALFPGESTGRRRDGSPDRSRSRGDR